MYVVVYDYTDFRQMHKALYKVLFTAVRCQRKRSSTNQALSAPIR